MTKITSNDDIDRLDFMKDGGTVTVVAQDAITGAVLMVARADREALSMTLRTGEMHYRSRSRGLWRKGATSGNVQRVIELAADCDGDAILASISPAGPACHSGTISCFGDERFGDALSRLAAVIEARATADRPTGYTGRLLVDRNLRLKKLGEECAELVTALADADPDRAREEGADLIYHMMVALRGVGVRLADLQSAIDARAER